MQPGSGPAGRAANVSGGDETLAVLELTPDDLAATRFALSPMAELVGALLILGGRSRPPGLGGWASQAGPRYLALRQADSFLAALTDLMCATTWLPDFICRPPRGMNTAFADELAAVRGTPVPVKLDETSGGLIYPCGLL